MKHLFFVQSLISWIGIMTFGLYFRSLAENYLNEHQIILSLNCIGLILGLQTIVVLGRWRSVHDK